MIAPPKTQARHFLNGEGDRYFSRNETFITRDWSEESDVMLTLLRQQRLAPKSVLDIGAANGFRLEAAARLYGAKAVAVEPSAAAVRDGRRRFPQVKFYRGALPELPRAVQKQRFDLVILHFVLHWVDRASLFFAAAEIDRVTAPSGYLLIADFIPPSPEKVRYHHIPEDDVWTYKQDYSRFFLESCLYRSVAASSGPTPVHLLQKSPVYAQKTIAR